MKRVIIAAVAENNIIGRDGSLPWHYPEDLEFFKSQTTNSPVIMGRRVAEGEHFPLDNRTNIVLSRSSPNLSSEFIICESIPEALSKAEATGTETGYIIGGETVYRQTINMNVVDEMLLTCIPGEYNGDTYFPEIDSEHWHKQEFAQLTDNITVYHYENLKSDD